MILFKIQIVNRNNILLLDLETPCPLVRPPKSTASGVLDTSGVIDVCAGHAA